MRAIRLDAAPWLASLRLSSNRKVSPAWAGKRIVITFNIARWRAWAPGLATSDDWLRWGRAELAPSTDEAPDVSFLPAMQRRRLSRLARMVFAVGWPLAEGHERLPMVFASRHGETPRTFDILGDLAARQPLSPTQFSLSVHNAIVGLWSIIRGATCEMTALAAAGDGLEHAVIEASALLAEGAPAVLLVVAEETPPPLYAPWIDDVPFPYALGLLLTAGEQWRMTLGDDHETSLGACRPHALDLAVTLASGAGHMKHQWKGRQWTWQRNL